MPKNWNFQTNGLHKKAKLGGNAGEKGVTGNDKNELW